MRWEGIENEEKRVDVNVEVELDKRWIVEIVESEKE